MLRAWKSRRTGERAAERDRATLSDPIRVSEGLWGERDTSVVLRRAVEQMHDVLGAHTTSAWILTPSGVRFGAASGAALWGHPAHATPPDTVQTCLRRGQFVANPLVSDAAIPITNPRHGTVAVLHVGGRTWDSEEVAFVEAIARQIGLVLEMAELHEAHIAEVERTRAVMDRIDDGVVVTTPDGLVLEWNRAIERMSALSAEDAVGMSCEDALGLVDGGVALDCRAGCPLVAAMDEGGAGRELERSDGGRRQTLLVSAAAIQGAYGGVAEVVHTVRDVTAEREADDARALFLATTSHELKTPLTVIKGFAQTLLAERSRLSPDVTEAALRAIDQRADDLARVVERLLLSSRIEAGRLDLAPRAVDVSALLASRVQDFAAASGRPLVADLPPAVALADPQALVTIVEHLLDNARKYSDDGTPIGVTSRALEQVVTISVTDEGIGMTAEDARRCFERFWQAHDQRSRGAGGSGIGLHIVRSLTEAMDGHVTVDSQPGAGSTFTLSLPCSQAPLAKDDVAELEPGRADPSVVREFMRHIGIPDRSAP